MFKESIMKNKRIEVSLSVVISREEKWFVASCPLLDLATQGKTEKEVKENMKDLLEDYFNDPDTKKPTIKTMKSASVSLIDMPVELEVCNGKTALIGSK